MNFGPRGALPSSRESDVMVDSDVQGVQVKENIKFTPSLSEQRHKFVLDFVRKHKPQKVADLGCANCKLLWRLKYHESIEVLAGLDIDENILTRNIYRLHTGAGDYLDPRERPLTITLYHGSVVEKDPCLLGFDLITCIELIEHLEAKELAQFPEAIFGFLSPTTVIISTPNSEFNPLFSGKTVFRHPDHKFEWDRTQFQSWALDAARHYGYSVEFTGLGEPPPGAEAVGFCTQIGVFVKNIPNTDESLHSEKTTECTHTKVGTVIYPSLKEEKYLRKAVSNEVFSYILKMKRDLLESLKMKNDSDGCDEPEYVQPECDEFKNDPTEETPKPFCIENVFYVPLERLFSFPKIKHLCGDRETLKMLIADEVTLSSDGSSVMINIVDEEDCDLNDNDGDDYDLDH
ncbi:small RNA 2'-O-methyltransferase isoform X1 [Monodelphis domestica]|uniref:small RNA 2'-O-methyltransferase isoform X1 n=1 Tax=Monodelphis domestica TaxID=13616 RepID=UPI000443291B|nr:small RNA 2'-O-methyltransferase isoform X1 [Monodelphis domestica]